MLLAAFALLFVFFTTASEAQKPNRLLLVSMDGFRWDHLNQTTAPSIWRLSREGTYSRRMRGVFPTLTFPSHWSIVTGNTPQKHGIVANSFYDPALRRIFRTGQTEEVWWNATEPIWVTAMRHNLSAATYFWPGSDVEIRGYRPKFWYNYTANLSPRTQVDTVVTWFKDKKIDVATIYFDEPDATMHVFGPGSPEVFAKIKDVDDAIGYLLRRMNESGLSSSTNLILLSDHGMATLHESRMINASQWIHTSDLEWFSPGAMLQVFPKPGFQTKVYNALKGAHPKFTVYMRNEIPARYQYGANKRIAPIVAIADEGWLITLGGFSTANRGGHGYDNFLNSMKSFVIARGPDFNTGVSVNEVSLVDIYPMMCRVLGITPQRHDGNICNVLSFLRSPLGGRHYETSAAVNQSNRARYLHRDHLRCCCRRADGGTLPSSRGRSLESLFRRLKCLIF